MYIYIYMPGRVDSSFNITNITVTRLVLFEW